MADYRALHSESESSAEYRPGEPNTELYIGILNIVLNIDQGPLIKPLYFKVIVSNFGFIF